ncbi:MAG: CusA/CzcA family heavy metal efflux RND transporter [Proteobacteria bacterium]|nr:MAG: CusA/CzcA family heavy metal efflux RND transporter [Pseudomonadota bacterium]
MLDRLIALSLRHRVVVLLATGLLLTWGLIAFAKLPFDAFPDTTPVQVSVNTTAPALSPLEVERQITFPLEQVIAGLPGLKDVRSLSKFGFSQITAVFSDEIDIYLARQVVSERLASVKLPAGVSRPTLGPVSTGLGEVFQYLIKSKRLSPMELRTLHHWVVRPQMLQVRGVAEINTWGGFEQQLHVLVDPDHLVKFDLNLDDVERALRRNNANVGGGYLVQGGEAQLVQGVGLARTIQQLEEIVVAARKGVPITIRDVAKVRRGHEVRRGAVTADGEGEVVLGLGFMLMGRNSRQLARALEARLQEAQKSLPAGVTLEPVYSRARLVDAVLKTVRDNLLEGALLVVAILFAFLGNLRAGLIVAAAIPLSMAFAWAGMLRFGIAGSLMSLGAIDFGLVVDSAVIMVENADKRLSDDTSDRAVREVIREAAVEVRRPTLFGELIIAIVYLPVLALEGVEGKLFRPMALTVLFALGASMVLSLTLMPVLASLFLRKRPPGTPHREPRLARALARLYRPALAWALRWRKVVLLIATLAVINAGLLATRIGSEFVPRLREMSIAINTVRLAGVSLAESVRYGSMIERHLKRHFPDEIEHIWTRTGTAEVATDPMGLEVSDVFMTLRPQATWRRAHTHDELVKAMRAAVADLPGMRAIFTQPIEMRVNEMVAGIRAAVGVSLYGDDFATLEAKAAEVRAVIEGVSGAADVSVEQLTGLPLLQVTVDRHQIARHGVSAETVLGVVAALGPRKVGEVVQGQRRFALALRLDKPFRDDPRRLGRVLVTAKGGERLPLSRLATIEVKEGPATITRGWAKRRVLIQANVRGRDVGSFVDELRLALADRVTLPKGYFLRFGGQFEHLERARTRLLVVVPVALALVLALLYLSFGSVRDALLVFSAVPFAAVGGIAALYLRALPFTISAGVGFIALFGVAVLGQLVLVSRFRQLLAGGIPLAQAIEQGARSRLRPVLMTALVASLGFLPMAVNTGVGAEVQGPLATVVIGGLITATLATLIVMPALYRVAAAKRERRGGGA